MRVQKNDLLDFLKCVDADFLPALTSKVDLVEYVDKISHAAHLVIHREKDEIAGLVVLYCNDMQTLRAYISLVAVRPSYRGKGIAKNIMKSAIKQARDSKMKVLGIHTNNPIALQLYENLGFEIVERASRSYLELAL